MRVLTQHEAALSGLRAGLVDLEASPSYLMLANDPLQGETKRKAGDAAAGAAELWPLINAAGLAIDETRNFVTLNGDRGRNKTELARMLTAPWVAVELGSTEQHMSIDQVLALFRTRFDAVQAWATEITDLWLAFLPRIDAAKATLSRLDTEATQLGVVEPLIGRARARATDLEERLVTDPLGVTPGEGAKLDDEVSAAAKQVASLRTSHDALEADFASTEELLASLRVVRARAEAAATEARTKVTGVDDVVRVPSVEVVDGAQGLAARLDDINRRTESDGAWTQRRTLLDGWLKTARKLMAQLERAEEANREPLVRRDELRGRLVAYRAKMAAMGKAEDLELTALADQARTTLFTAPAELEQAATTMNELARRLRS